MDGMVLMVAPASEYDRRLVLLTKQCGRITAFARGARRQNSSLLGVTQPFVSGRFTLYPGRSAYSLVQVSVLESFSKLREDLLMSCYGSYFMELAMYYARENLEATDMLNLLYVTLSAMEQQLHDLPLIRAVYEIRLMTVNGEFPLEAEQNKTQQSAVRYALAHAAAAPLGRLYAFRLTDEAADELIRISDQVRRRTIDRPLKSLEFLEVVAKNG